jgi:hypothetical protein
VTKVKELLVPKGGNGTRRNWITAFLRLMSLGYLLVKLDPKTTSLGITPKIVSLVFVWHIISNSKLNEMLRWGRGPLRILWNTRAGSLFGRPMFRGRLRSTIGG